MKVLTLALALLFSSVAFAQSDNTDQTYLSTPSTSLVIKSQNPILASAQDLSFTGQFARGGGSEEGKCGKYHKMKTAGIVLAAVGGGLLVTGITLEAIAVHREFDGNGDFRDVGLVGGGAACIVFGVLGAGAGIPLAIIGSVKSRKYCGGSGRANLNLQSGRNGTGLALNF